MTAIDDAETLAVQALAWIAADADMLNRFSGVTGIAPDRMRQAAGEPGFLAGVLDFLLAHEPTLISFSTEAEIDPKSVVGAREALRRTVG